MDPETKQELLTISLLMKKAREQEESEKAAEREAAEGRQAEKPAKPCQELLPLGPAVNPPSFEEDDESGLVAGIKNYLASAEDFGQAEELLLATWLLCRRDLDFNICYDHCQSRTAIYFTFKTGGVFR